MSKNKPSAINEETAKAESALREHQKKQETKLIVDEQDQQKALNQGFTRKATVYFKNNKNGKYHLDSACTKVLIEGCHNTEIHLNGRINTEVVELWNCENLTLVVSSNSKAKTLQVDLSKNLTVRFVDKSSFGQIIWAGIDNLDLQVGDDNLSTGVEKVDRSEIPDFKERFDQFIVRYVKGKLLQELVVRLDNGFPTTEREAAAFDEQKEKNDRLYEAHVRRMISTKVAGISDKLDQLSKTEVKKVGRNDPCTCGSGKKYKKCCEGKEGLTEEQKKQIEDAKKELADKAEEEKKAALEMSKVAGQLVEKNTKK